MRIPSAIALLMTVLVSLSRAMAENPAATTPPNILVILADDLGFSDLGCYGSEIATPNLDALAQNGLRFTQAYNCARCWPSRAALLTGYYPQQVRRDGLPGNKEWGSRGKRPEWARLVPDFLKPAGYRCYHSGKWHVDGKVLEGGFDRSLDMRNQGNYFSQKGNSIDDKPISVSKDEPNYYATTGTVDHALECLKDHAANHSKRPFLQYLAFIAPHFPLHAPPEDIAKYQDRYLGGWDTLRTERHARQLKLGLLSTNLAPIERQVGPPYPFPDAMDKLGTSEVNRPLPWEELNAEQKRFQATKMAIHAAMIDRMDREIGRVLDQLRTMKAFDNTLILFASDNGASAEIMVRDGGHNRSASPGSAATYLCLGPGFSSAANTPFRRHKTWVHEGGISTPLIAHWPNGIKARGEFRTDAVHLVDIVPTLLDVARVKKPAQWNGAVIPAAPGVSLVPAFAGNGVIKHEMLWWYHEGNRAIRKGDWKLVASNNAPWELYNLAQDRSETKDLAAENADLVKELEAAWNAEADRVRALGK